MNKTSSQFLLVALVALTSCMPQDKSTETGLVAGSPDYNPITTPLSPSDVVFSDTIALEDLSAVTGVVEDYKRAFGCRFEIHGISVGILDEATKEALKGLPGVVHYPGIGVAAPGTILYEASDHLSIEQAVYLMLITACRPNGNSPIAEYAVIGTDITITAVHGLVLEGYHLDRDGNEHNTQFDALEIGAGLFLALEKWPELAETLQALNTSFNYGDLGILLKSLAVEAGFTPGELARMASENGLPEAITAITAEFLPSDTTIFNVMNVMQQLGDGRLSLDIVKEYLMYMRSSNVAQG